MNLVDLSAEDTRLYVKSEFGPVGDYWPALSFSSRKIAGDFAQQYRRDRDFVIYVGTGDPEKTANPNHRRRLLSVAVVEPRTPISTKDIVPAESWTRSIHKWGVRWEWSLPITAAYDIIGLPEARNYIPEAYRGLGTLHNLGRCSEVLGDEHAKLLQLLIAPVEMQLSLRVESLIHLNTEDKDLRREISRLANLIRNDVARAGTEYSGANPMRCAPNFSDVYQILMQKWKKQEECCALCGGPISLLPSNRLLQMSRDRIDSANKAYDWQNVQITHLGCNLAKSEATMQEWLEYLMVVRGACSVDGESP